MTKEQKAFRAAKLKPHSGVLSQPLQLQLNALLLGSGMESHNDDILTSKHYRDDYEWTDEKGQKVYVDAAKQTSSASNSGIGMGLAAVGAGIGIGLIGFSALSGIARQPEQAGYIQGVMYVMAALVEGVAIIAVILSFLVAARIMG